MDIAENPSPFQRSHQQELSNIPIASYRLKYLLGRTRFRLKELSIQDLVVEPNFHFQFYSLCLMRLVVSYRPQTDFGYRHSIEVESLANSLIEMTGLNPSREDIVRNARMITVEGGSLDHNAREARDLLAKLNSVIEAACNLESPTLKKISGSVHMSSRF